MSDLHVDPVLLDGIADRLRRSGDAIDAAGHSAPGLPDAGADSAAIAAVVAGLCGQSAHLVAALHETGSKVTAANRTYVDEDTTAAAHIAETR